MTADTAVSQRDSAGRFLPGNRAAVTHGIYVRQERPDIAAMVSERCERLAVHMGHEISEVEAPLLRQLARVQVLAEDAGRQLDRQGVRAGKGAVRALYSLYERLLDREMALSRMIGLQRRTRHVGVGSVVDAIKGATDVQ